MTKTSRWNSLFPTFLLALLIAIGLSPFGWWKYLGIAFDKSITTGMVVSTNCASRNGVTYSFDAKGILIQGQDDSRSCRSLKSGDEVQISFSVGDPTKNIVGDASNRFLSETFTILLVSVVSAFVIVRVMSGSWRGLGTA